MMRKSGQAKLNESVMIMLFNREHIQTMVNRRNCRPALSEFSYATVGELFNPSKGFGFCKSGPNFLASQEIAFFAFFRVFSYYTTLCSKWVGSR